MLSRTLTQIIPTSLGLPSSFAWLPSNNQLWVCGWTENVVVIDGRSNEVVKRLGGEGGLDPFTMVCFDGSWMWGARRGGGLIAWNPNTGGEVFRSSSHSDQITGSLLVNGVTL